MLTQQTTNTWRNLAHPSDVSPSRCRRSVFFSKQQRTRIFGCRCASRHHACHLLSKSCKTLMFCALLTRSTISCACHAKQHLNLQKWSEPLVFWTFWLRNVLRVTTACTFSTSELPKVVRTPGVFNILTWKCASRHNGVHFFDIATSKSGPTLRYLVHFHLEICFAPQRRALFRHLNCQKWSGLVCFVPFDFEMCFAPQRRAIFHLSSGQLAPHPPL